jgi:hypothetical protein
MFSGRRAATAKTTFFWHFSALATNHCKNGALQQRHPS